eukprot:scaffold55148_cov49-Cyclotella_meneghiniana.AAC.11
MKLPIIYGFIALIASSHAFELNWSSIVQTSEDPPPLQQLSLEQTQPISIQAVDDTAITISGESVDIDILANDILPNGNNVSIKLRERGNNGICVIHDDTQFIVYYPMHRYAGYDECQYILCDTSDSSSSEDNCDVATVTVTIVKSTEFQQEEIEVDGNRPVLPLPSVEEILDGLDVTGLPETKPPIEEEKGDSNDFNLLDLNDAVVVEDSNDTTCRDLGQVAAQVISDEYCPSENGEVSPTLPTPNDEASCRSVAYGTCEGAIYSYVKKNGCSPPTSALLQLQSQCKDQVDLLYRHSVNVNDIADPALILPSDSNENDVAVEALTFTTNNDALNSFHCPPGQSSITIEVQADKYGDDTTWTLVREYEDGTTELVLEGGPYDSNGFDSRHVCAPKPSLWRFAISDQYGDGFCCKHGNGYYTIFLDNVKVVHVTHFADTIENVINVGYDPNPVMTERDHAYLIAHNKRRKKWHEMHNVSYVPLQWSPKLAEMSLKWANELLDDCDSTGIEHEPGVAEGENLAKNHGNYGEWGQLYPPENIVRRWVDFEETWPWPANAHLTQALWRASKYMGCGESVKDWRGGKCRVQVCRYAKSGNCDMGSYNTTEGMDWLTPMLALNSPCEPSCPPEGCY